MRVNLQTLGVKLDKLRAAHRKISDDLRSAWAEYREAGGTVPEGVEIPLTAADVRNIVDSAVRDALAKALADTQPYGDGKGGVVHVIVAKREPKQ